MDTWIKIHSLAPNASAGALAHLDIPTPSYLFLGFTLQALVRLAH